MAHKISILFLFFLSSLYAEKKIPIAPDNSWIIRAGGVNNENTIISTGRAIKSDNNQIIFQIDNSSEKDLINQKLIFKINKYRLLLSKKRFLIAHTLNNDNSHSLIGGGISLVQLPNFNHKLFQEYKSKLTGKKLILTGEGINLISSKKIIDKKNGFTLLSVTNFLDDKIRRLISKNKYSSLEYYLYLISVNAGDLQEEYDIVCKLIAENKFIKSSHSIVIENILNKKNVSFELTKKLLTLNQERLSKIVYRYIRKNIAFDEYKNYLSFLNSKNKDLAFHVYCGLANASKGHIKIVSKNIFEKNKTKLIEECQEFFYIMPSDNISQLPYTPHPDRASKIIKAKKSLITGLSIVEARKILENPDVVKVVKPNSIKINTISKVIYKYYLKKGLSTQDDEFIQLEFDQHRVLRNIISKIPVKKNIE